MRGPRSNRSGSDVEHAGASHADEPLVEVPEPTANINDLSAAQGHGHRIDGEVAAPKILLQGALHPRHVDVRHSEPVVLQHDPRYRLLVIQLDEVPTKRVRQPPPERQRIGIDRKSRSRTGRPISTSRTVPPTT